MKWSLLWWRLPWLVSRYSHSNPSCHTLLFVCNARAGLVPNHYCQQIEMCVRNASNVGPTLKGTGGTGLVQKWYVGTFFDSSRHHEELQCLITKRLLVILEKACPACVFYNCRPAARTHIFLSCPFGGTTRNQVGMRLEADVGERQIFFRCRRDRRVN
jgi:hypothetical protein